MVDQFQAFLLLAVIILFAFIVIRVIQSDRRDEARRSRRRDRGPNQPTRRRSPYRHYLPRYNFEPQGFVWLQAQVVLAVLDPPLLAELLAIMRQTRCD